jgi:hypothetical protein
MEQNHGFDKGHLFRSAGFVCRPNDGSPAPSRAVSAKNQNHPHYHRPKERYDILMNSFTERTWMAVIMGQEINKLMATYAKCAPRKSRSLTYNGSITLSQYEHFDWIRGQLVKEGVQITLPTGN